MLAEVTVGYAGWFTPRREVFPFSSWSMFALVPNRLSEYDLLLHGTAGQPQEPPRSLNQSRGLVHAPHSVVTHQLVQQFGQAVEGNDPTLAEGIRRQVEEQFAVAHVRYDLIQVAYRPVPRWQSGQVLSQRFLRSFVATQPPLLNPDLPPPLERDEELPPPAAQSPASP